MRFDLLTPLPELVEGYLAAGILGRARDAGLIRCDAIGLRDFGSSKTHHSLDDAPYGGGSGMVMKVEPLAAAIDAIARTTAPDARRRVLLLDPAGRTFDQHVAREITAEVDHLVLVCGRYEGVDARVHGRVDGLLSLGDFVLTGGELAALAVIDAVARLVPGVLGNSASASEESFEGPLLEYPQYTRPAAFEGERVPAILRSGDHGRIARWRLEQRIERTLELRPDLLADRASLPREWLEIIESLDNSSPQE